MKVLILSTHMMNLFLLISNHIFDTYRFLHNPLQLHNDDIQTLTLPSIHVNDFLKKHVRLETRTQFAQSFLRFLFFNFTPPFSIPHFSTNFVPNIFKSQVKNIYFSKYSNEHLFSKRPLSTFLIHLSNSQKASLFFYPLFLMTSFD